jgi:ParB/RepB/Spo0J family partition protein
MQTETQTNGRSAKKLFESATNPRKRFKGIPELAKSMCEHGQLSPAVVRQMQSKPDAYEIVFGARRFRALKDAGVHSMLVIVREMNDQEVLEAQIVENCQREDVHPLEEAEAFEVLRKRNMPIGTIAQKIGTTPAYITQRLKLCALSPLVREAFYADKIPTGVAFLIARIPDHAQQKEALAECTRVDSWRHEAPSVTQCAELIQNKFMLRLDEALFDKKSLTLVEKAGACGPCPKRTGNQPDLFGDVKAKDLCTDAVCFRAKQDADFRVRAVRKGTTVLSSKAAAEVFQYSHVNSTAPYVDLADTVYEDKRQRKWGDVLAKADELPPIALVRDEKGNPHELISKADAFKLAAELGNAWAKGKKAAKKADRTDAKKDREKNERRTRMLRALTGAIVDKAERSELKTATLRALVRAMIRATWQATLEDVLKRRAIDAPKRTAAAGHKVAASEALLKWATRAKPEELRGMAFELVIGKDCAFEIGASMREAAAALKVDVKKVAGDSAKGA